MYRPLDSALEQRVVNRANACPDIEEQAGRVAVAALRHCGLHILDEHPGRTVRALAPEFRELATCPLRVEQLINALALSAAHAPRKVIAAV